jgi:hypothetical protein
MSLTFNGHMTIFFLSLVTDRTGIGRVLTRNTISIKPGQLPKFTPIVRLERLTCASFHLPRFPISGSSHVDMRVKRAGGIQESLLQRSVQIGLLAQRTSGEHCLPRGAEMGVNLLAQSRSSITISRAGILLRFFCKDSCCDSCKRDTVRTLTGMMRGNPLATCPEL